MSKDIEGTPQDLYRLRQARRDTVRVISSLGQAGVDATSLQATYADLMDTVVFIPVPCIVCKRTFPQPAEVAGDSLPYAVLCEDCTAKIEAEVGVMGDTKLKRKRRTKAEMEAARLAKQQAQSGA